MPDDDLVVEIDETADANLATAVDPAATKEKVAPKETESKPDPIAELKAQHDESLARERQRASAAEQRAASEAQARNAAEQERDAVRSEAADTQLTALEQALAAANTAADAAESELSAANEAGDWKKAAQAQRKLSAAVANAETLKRDRADLELRKAQRPEPTQRQTQQQTSYSDPVEQFISFAGRDQQGQPVQRTSAAQTWMRNHRDVVADAVNDQRKMMKLGAADQLAVAEGLERDTPEYFAHVEKTLGIAKPAATNGAANGKQNGAQRRQSAPVAPVQQSAGETQGGGDVVRLTKGEAQTATDGTIVWNFDDPSPQKRYKKGDPIGVQEFARRKLALQKDGQYDKSKYEN